MSAVREAVLVLADGSEFEGELIGADPVGGVAGGEVVFNTVLSGYQEVITDPSYAGQVITFTNPHIGNYGINDHDFEATRPYCRGVIVREMARRHSNYRADDSLDAMLRRFGISGIAGIDTRRLTRLLRDTGAMPGVFGTADESTLKAALANEHGTDGIELQRRMHEIYPQLIVIIMTGYASVATAVTAKSSSERRLNVCATSGLQRSGRGARPLHESE